MLHKTIRSTIGVKYLLAVKIYNLVLLRVFKLESHN